MFSLCLYFFINLSRLLFQAILDNEGKHSSHLSILSLCLTWIICLSFLKDTCSFTHLCLLYMLISLPIISTLLSIIYDVHPDKLIFHLQNLAQMLSKGILLWPYSRIHHSLLLQDRYTFYTSRPWIALYVICRSVCIPSRLWEFLKGRSSFFISTVTGIMSDTEWGLKKHLLKGKQKKLLNELAQNIRVRCQAFPDPSIFRYLNLVPSRFYHQATTGACFHVIFSKWLLHVSCWVYQTDANLPRIM